MSVVIETTLGDITVDLFINDRPRACLNFLKLCKIKYYNYNLFHTISRGFIAQTGDPTGSRTGGESIYGVLDGLQKRYFESENEPRIKHTKMGLISFVGNEDCMIGSQFFLTLGEDLTYLDEKHCVFGEVVEGFDLLEVINEVICDNEDRPYQDVRITHTVILDDPFPDPKRLIIPSRSPSPSDERLKGGRIAPDEEIDEFEGKTIEEVVEMQADREAKARATILEMVGDLPDAEMAPPENVLFVCKLNPVTNDDDLEIIFSRFGKIKSCEVIRDKKTGDSLQYAFVEFEDKLACENAYFKMDNVLIDDRRIHVDFSQSVSKVKWQGKGRGVTHFDERGRKSKKIDSDIGKGNYKHKKSNGYHKNDYSRSSKENREQSLSKPNRKYKNNDEYERKRSLSPRRVRSSYDSAYSRAEGSRQQKSRSRSPRQSKYAEIPKHNYRTNKSEYKEETYSSRGNRNRSTTPGRSKSGSTHPKDRDRYSSSRNRKSISPIRKQKNSSPSRSKRNERPERESITNRKSRSVSPRRINSKKDSYEKTDKNSRNVFKKSSDRDSQCNKNKIISKNRRLSSSDSDHVSKKPEKYKKQNIVSSTKSNRISSHESPERKRNKKDENRREADSETERKQRKIKETKKKSKDSSNTSDTSDSEDSERKRWKSRNKKKKSKDSSSDSDSSEPKRKRKKVVQSESSESDSNSDSDSDYKKRKSKKKVVKKGKHNSASDSGDDYKKKRKYKKHSN